MTDWDPPIDGGLSGDRYLSVDIESFVDGDLGDAHAPGVYSLRLSTPDDRDTVRERWTSWYDVDVPDWIWTAFECGTVLYVGAAANVFDRVTQHLEAPNRTASICRVFPVHSVWDVWWFDSAERAFERESGIAMSVANTEGVYVHQR